jgi:predicted acyl esterase
VAHGQVVPPEPLHHRPLAFCAEGGLAFDEGTPGARDLMVLRAGLNRAKPSVADPPKSLTWTTVPLEKDLDMVGDIELLFDAPATAMDTAGIVTLQDVDAHNQVADVTAGRLRAGLREVDEDASRTGAPVLRGRRAEAVPVGESSRHDLCKCTYFATSAARQDRYCRTEP